MTKELANVLVTADELVTVQRQRAPDSERAENGELAVLCRTFSVDTDQ